MILSGHSSGCTMNEMQIKVFTLDNVNCSNGYLLNKIFKSNSEKTKKTALFFKDFEFSKFDIDFSD